ncbi:hypothetical protein OOK41_03595 [Micromonospora sp. NBC_01655]|uniref:hypothetical protein n=1 Tax=Micromonospora sp. NBC_01655 TaxID=2975983 RepID=UPI00225AB3FA|nr:hypothetical protein [Micromonospora sp. NBC_01655]MCX4469400.1 hypothetical protein [Micromonospora sp. NBC_01655]
MYGSLVIGDPYCDAEEDDTAAARAAARANAIAATRYHAYLHTAQSIREVRIVLRVWEENPGKSWPPRNTDDNTWVYRTVSIECSEGQLIVDNVSAGPVGFEPGALERIPLSGGPGLFLLHVSIGGRNDINERIVSAWSIEDNNEQVEQLRLLDGYERYIVNIARVGPLTDDEDDDLDEE